MDSGKFFAGSSMILLLIFIILYVYIYNLYLSCFFFLSFYYIYTYNNISIIENVEEMMTPAAATRSQERRGKPTPFVSLVTPFLERVVEEEDDTSGNIHFFSKYQIRTNPLFDSKQPSNLGLRRMRKGHPNLARGDASQSGFVRPTLIRDGKSIGRQGEVTETQRKSQKVDLTRKQDTNFRRMIPHVVSASLSEFVLPTSISKGGKPIETHKHKGQEKRLSSVAERRKSVHIGLVRKQDKQVVRTQRTITRVVPAQGHIPVVRSGFERPTLIQKDSKSIGSEKLQGPEKLLSSVVESKQKSGNVDSSRKNDIKVVGTRKDLVDERSLQPVSKQNNVKAVPQVPPYKGRKINSTSELKARWKF